MEAGAEPNYGLVRTPLQWALVQGKEEAAEALIKCGADVDFGNPPPLTIAASLGRKQTLLLMLEKGVNLAAEV
jgi:ankyrin repeat protein